MQEAHPLSGQEAPRGVYRSMRDPLVEVQEEFEKLNLGKPKNIFEILEGKDEALKDSLGDAVDAVAKKRGLSAAILYQLMRLQPDMDARGKLMKLQRDFEEKEKNEKLSEAQRSRLGQVEATVVLIQAFGSLLSEGKAQGEMSGFLMKLNRWLGTLRTDPQQFTSACRAFLENVPKMRKAIEKDPSLDGSLAMNMYDSENVLKTLKKLSTPSFFGIEKGEAVDFFLQLATPIELTDSSGGGVNFMNLDCKTEEELNKYRGVVMDMLGDVKTTGGHFQVAREQLAAKALEKEFNVILLSQFRLEDQIVEDYGPKTVKVIPSVYKTAQVRMGAKVDIDFRLMRHRFPDQYGKDISLWEKDLIDVFAYQDYLHLMHDVVGQTMYRLIENKEYGLNSPAKRDLFERYAKSRGFGAASVSDEEWDSFMSSAIHTSTALISGVGVGKVLSYGGAALMDVGWVANLMGKMGRVGHAAAEATQFAGESAISSQITNPLEKPPGETDVFRPKGVGGEVADFAAGEAKTTLAQKALSSLAARLSGG